MMQNTKVPVNEISNRSSSGIEMTYMMMDAGIPLKIRVLSIVSCNLQNNASLRNLRTKIKSVPFFPSSPFSRRLHQPVAMTLVWLQQVIRGHLNYYGVPGNGRQLNQFHNEVVKRWLKMLRRRSQRHTIRWEKFGPW